MLLPPSLLVVEEDFWWIDRSLGFGSRLLIVWGSAYVRRAAIAGYNGFDSSFVFTAAERGVDCVADGDGVAVFVEDLWGVHSCDDVL